MEEKHQCFLSVYHSCSADAGTFFSEKNTYFHSGLLEAVYKAVQEKGACWPSPGAAHEDDTSVVPVLSEDEAAEGSPTILGEAFPRSPASRKDRLQRSERCPISQIRPCHGLSLPRTLGVFVPGSARWGSMLAEQCPPQGWTGPPARPRSPPPFQHTRPLSSTDANGLGSFLRHKGSHWPWKCFCLSFPFSWTQPHTSCFPDIMLPFVAVSSSIWGML